MGFKPQDADDFPTLGWECIDWIAQYLNKPGTIEDTPFIMYPEQEDFILRFYEIDPVTGRRKYERGVLSRPRGWGKSPFAGALAWLEALGPVRFDGWDASGQPVGRPWVWERTPEVFIAAVSGDQTMNTWSTMLEMGENGNLLDDYPGLEVMQSQINLPRGRITPMTASATSAKGNRACFAVLDQTEVWTRSNGGVNLFQTIKSNTAKLDGTFLETPNAFIPGLGSVAEMTAKTAYEISIGESKIDSLLYDHREAPGDTDLADEKSLIKGLRIAYGDSSGHPDGCVLHDPPCPPGHVNLRPLINSIWDSSTDVQVARSDFLNQVTHASDSWVSAPEMRAILDDSKKLIHNDAIVLGFDGSRGRSRGHADATALVAIRLRDKCLFEIRIWERGPNTPQDWVPPADEIDATVKDCFEQYSVVGFYADPSGWESYVAQWEADFGRKLRVKGSLRSPIAVWPRGKDSRVHDLLVQLRQAIVEKELCMATSPRLLNHFLNARRRQKRAGYLLYKAYPDSPEKIDGAYASVMAYKALLDATSAGLSGSRTRRKRRKAVIL